ncbi:hypothetical protein K469DRAFT_169977 [Zopfia rhizophila CBS 207.26]|uniref:Diphthamide biosynthesis protein 4 n=1 Tax=Zopfia rhizophila CBS 207.26 TaxID=1314779 RepID=A0A6A6E1H8_9PEZI|nr:hypothetical protein K469DRAFT_169977 [Zopfia rhizophila CBS 207.26]
MVYTKNYYKILGLETPTYHCSSHDRNFEGNLKAQYHRVLRAVHPDKEAYNYKTRLSHRPSIPVEPFAAEIARKYTVDDVREAYAVLNDPMQKKEYDAWIVRKYAEGREKYFDGNLGLDLALQGSRGESAGTGHAYERAEDFVLGLELLSLDDFTESGAVSTPSEDGSEMGQVWMRACRCGDERGFRIEESELEGAERRGESEVLVGCQGCSLWVRVGFEVLEGHEEGAKEGGKNGFVVVE